MYGMKKLEFKHKMKSSEVENGNNRRCPAARAKEENAQMFMKKHNSVMTMTSQGPNTGVWTRVKLTSRSLTS